MYNLLMYFLEHTHLEKRTRTSLCSKQSMLVKNSKSTAWNIIVNEAKQEVIKSVKI